MPRTIVPALDQLDSLEPALSSAERQALAFFDRKLPQGWEIYVRPHLNGLQPSLVLLNPSVGIAAFEVLDLTEQASEPGGNANVFREVAGRMVLVNDGFLELYCPRLAINASAKTNAYLTLITCGAIVVGPTTQEAREQLLPRLQELGVSEKGLNYYPVSGLDALERGDMGSVYPSAVRGSNLMEPAFADDLRSWLVEPDALVSQREPLEMNNHQRKLVLTRNKSGYRRIRGAAGSGKSLVLAARAAQLSAEGKDVLVVTFNITILHYLRSLAMRYQAPKKSINNRITWIHFHQWCKRTCFETGFGKEYIDLWRNNKGSKQQILEHEMNDLTAMALSRNLTAARTYDAILVDEGQDYNPEWWTTLRSICRPGGEMILVADETQDLYERAKSWTDDRMKGAGFTGEWVKLQTSYRLPPTIIRHLETFTDQHLKGAAINVPQAEQTELDLWPVKLRWVQLGVNQDAAAAAVEAVLAAPAASAPEAHAFSDVTLLVQDHEMGLRCIELFDKRNVRTAHVFGREHMEKKNRKLAFYVEDARVKAATIHSFKGWESRSVVVHIGRAATFESLAAVYVALSRLKRHTGGSQLTVLCSEPKLAAYGKTWPMFEGQSTNGDQPAVTTNTTHLGSLPTGTAVRQDGKVAGQQSGNQAQSSQKLADTGGSRHPWLTTAKQIRDENAVGIFEMPCSLSGVQERETGVTVYFDLLDGIEPQNIPLSGRGLGRMRPHLNGAFTCIKVQREVKGKALTFIEARLPTEDECAALWASAPVLGETILQNTSLVQATGFVRDEFYESDSNRYDPNAEERRYLLFESISGEERRIAIRCPHNVKAPKQNKLCTLLLRNRNAHVWRGHMSLFSLVMSRDAESEALQQASSVVTLQGKVLEYRQDKNENRYALVVPVIRNSQPPMLVYHIPGPRNGGPKPGESGEFILQRQRADGNFYSFVRFMPAAGRGSTTDDAD